MLGHQKFYELLDHYPMLSDFWDRETNVLNEASARSAVRNMGTSERTLLKCLVSIWTGGKQANCSIGFLDLAKIDWKYRKPMLNWLSTPFVP